MPRDQGPQILGTHLPKGQLRPTLTKPGEITSTDVNGDRRPDVVGFGASGVQVSLNKGSSFAPPKLWLADFGYNAGGWRVESHPRVPLN